MRFYKSFMLIPLSLAVNYAYSNSFDVVSPHVQVGDIYSESTHSSSYTPCISGEVVRNDASNTKTNFGKSHRLNTITYSSETLMHLYTESFKSKEFDEQCLSDLVSNSSFSEIQDKAHYISAIVYGVKFKQNVILDFPNTDIADHIWANGLLSDAFYNDLDDELKSQKVSVYINYEIIDGAASLLEENGSLQDRVFTCDLIDYQLCDDFAQLSKELIVSENVIPNDFEYSTPIAIFTQDLSVYFPSGNLTDHSNNRYFELPILISSVSRSINTIKSNLSDLKFHSLDEVNKQYNDLENLKNLKLKIETFKKYYDNSINNEEMISKLQDEYIELLHGASL